MPMTPRLRCWHRVAVKPGKPAYGVYARDDRPSGGTQAQAVWFRYSPDRKGIHPQSHLKNFEGILQADAYAGYNEVYRTCKVTQAGCWAHARRKFHDIHVHRPSDITHHVLTQIGRLYEIEAGIRGSPPPIRPDTGHILYCNLAWLRVMYCDKVPW